ncbi:MAG: hypothetical protein RMJ15_03100 [Nitrososphaerota archaeon]|nr:hypothetical protein [Candidatus Bathyarchaeota archaeon]MDW8022714.1 hypothetical protein [Nitrososphaerota archaeon]
MKKSVVAAALVIIAMGFVLAISVQEKRVVEYVIDEWNPITPSTLYPHWNHDANEFNSTGYAFISRAKGNPQKKALLESGEILELYLDLDISASGPVRVRVGSISSTDNSLTNYQFHDPQLPPKYNLTVIFDESGSRIFKRVRIDGTNADFLDIINEGAVSVNISGAIKLIGKLPTISYPFLGPGTLMCLIGFFLLFYGVLAKPKRRIMGRKGKGRI